MAIASRHRSRSPTERTPPGGQSQVGETADLDVGSSDPARELETLLQMSLGIVEAERPQLDGAQVHQGDGPGVVAEHDLLGGLGRRRVEQRLHLVEDRAEVASPACERHPGDPERDVEAVPAFVGHLGGTSLGEGEVRRRAVQRAVDQLVGGEGPRQLRVREGVLREGGKQGVHRRVLTVEREAEAVVGDQSGGMRPVRGSLRVPDRVGHQPVLLQPRGCAPVQLGYDARFGAAQLETQQVGEELVIAEPRPLGVDGDHEGVRLLELEQDPLGPGGVDEDVGEGSGHPLQDRGAQQESPRVFRLALEHLGEQVVGDGALAAGELGDEPLGVGVAGERERRQPQSGGPALRPRRGA